MNVANRQSRAFFEARYQTSRDPWRFESSAYERDRYEATLNALTRPSYRRGFEPGCSIGVLTAALAPRVAQLIACDLSEVAVARAQERCRAWKNVQIHGANLSVRADAYQDVGGWSNLPLAEDHCLWGRLRRHGWRVSSPVSSVVITSPRLQGRAKGGFADTLRRHIDAHYAES
jgi:hypothetical protein